MNFNGMLIAPFDVAFCVSCNLLRRVYKCTLGFCTQQFFPFTLVCDGTLQNVTDSIIGIPLVKNQKTGTLNNIRWLGTEKIFNLSQKDNAEQFVNISAR